MSKIYFSIDDFPNMRNEYILWVDIMGTKNNMSSSVKTCSIFICKLHMAILEALNKRMHVYPVMDGAYVTTESDQDMKNFIDKLFNILGDNFIEEKTDFHRFLVKASLAYGPLTHGKDIPDSCNNYIKSNREYMDSILLGMPMIQASKGEKKAPPFGIFCDESARIASPTFEHRWHKWVSKKKTQKMLEEIKKYFDYARSHYFELNYPIEKIQEHEVMAKQYFTPSYKIE